MNAFDTNIWIYCHDQRDSIKQGKAQQLIATVRPVALPWQVGCEFIAAARKLTPFGFSLDDAWSALENMQQMADALLLPSGDLWPHTRNLQARFSLSFWDALLVASCLSGGVKTLYSEDFGGRHSIDGLALINPFAAS